jgi:hypothetical protein
MAWKRTASHPGGGGRREIVGTVSDAVPLILKSPFARLSSLLAKVRSVRCKFDFMTAVSFKEKSAEMIHVKFPNIVRR